MSLYKHIMKCYNYVTMQNACGVVAPVAMAASEVLSTSYPRWHIVFAGQRCQKGHEAMANSHEFIILSSGWARFCRSF
jgi:hypothetical protein